jgi:uncharacterized protein YqeY
VSDSLADRLHVDMVAAMKAKDKDRLSVLRMLIAGVKDAAIEKRAALKDDETLRVLSAYAKKRQEAQAEARKAGRDELAAREEFELSVVRSYLPQPLTDAQLQELVDTVVVELGAASIKDMGRVMKACLERAAGRADGSRLNPLVKARLGG